MCRTVRYIIAYVIRKFGKVSLSSLSIPSVTTLPSLFLDKGPAATLKAPEMRVFLNTFFAMHVHMPTILSLEPNIAMYDIAWWVHSQDECIKNSHEHPSRYLTPVQRLFLTVHFSVSKTSSRIEPSPLIPKLRVSVASGIGNAAQLAGASGKTCSKSFEYSDGRPLAECSCSATNSLIQTDWTT